MRIVLCLQSLPASLPEALTRRGHHVARVGREVMLDDPTSADVTNADLLVVDGEVAEQAELAGRLMAAAPGIEVVVVGAARTSPDVLAHLERPLDVDRVLAVIDELAEILDGQRLREPVDLVAYETLFAGDSPQIKDLVRRVRLVARSDAPVWIFGDDGSGRGIVARAIHDRSARRRQPFVAVNCAAHADDELCRLLFHGDAAIEAARDGSLFLERIALAGPETQRELVRYLEAGNKDGSSPRLIVGVQRAVALGSPQLPLSNELYFRLKVLEVEIPLLRDRGRDLEQIVARMLDRLAPNGRPRITADAMALLQRYEFPGNLLELAHALTHAYVLASGAPIEPQHLPVSIRRATLVTSGGITTPVELEALDVVAKRFERDYLLQVLRNVGGNRGRAAEILGLSRKGLWGKLKAHGISDDEIEPD